MGYYRASAEFSIKYLTPIFILNTSALKRGLMDQNLVDCNTCRDLAPVDPQRHPYMRAKVPELRNAATKGCHMCSLLYEALVMCVSDDHLQGDGYLMWSNFGFLFIGSEDWQDETAVVRLDIFQTQDIATRFVGFEVGHPIPGDTQSNESLATVKDWLYTCVNYHHCQAKDEGPLPKCVVDITKSTVCLVEPGSSMGRYCCLSHCWGPVRPACITTRANIASQKQEVSWDKLPQTFRDAIDFCRHLQIHFLWIDSICIIQDDWREEAAKMAWIYANSYLTIAATSSNSGDGGCYSKADLRYHAKHIRTQGFMVRQALPHISNGELFVDRASTFPLLTRGWVYQERLLSRRMLHFASNELIWECREGRACECSKSYLLHDAENQFLDRGSVGRISMTTPDGRNDPPKSVWYTMVTEYSALNLTMEKDKFPAFAGLAREMQQERPGEKYLAGLWEGSVIQDLLWRCGRKVQRKPASWRVPSWSWASVNSPVSFVIGTPWESVKVIAADCIAAGPDPYGELVSAFLDLWIQGCPARITRKHTPEGEAEEQKYCLWLGDIEADEFLIDFDPEEDCMFSPPSEVRCLNVAGLRLNETMHNECLVVRRVRQEGRIYERIGWMQHRLLDMEGIWGSTHFDSYRLI